MSATAFQRRRRELEAQRLAEQEQQQQNPVDDVDGENKEQAAGFTPEQVEEMTKAQIIDALKDAGVEFDQRDNKEALKGLLLDVIK